MAEIIRTPIVSEHPRRLDGRTGHLLGPTAVEAPAPIKEAPIKQAPVEPREPVVDPAELEGLRNEAARAVDRAERAEARAVVLEQELAGGAEERRRDGYEQGRQQGFDAAHAEADESLREALERIERITTEAEASFRERLEERVEDSVVEVVCAAVAKIVGEAAADPVHVAEIVQRMLQEVERAESVAIHLAPADYELLVEAQGGLPVSLDSEHLSFVPDERVQCGGCLLKTPAGELDGRLETQLRRFKKLMLETRRRQSGSGRARP